MTIKRDYVLAYLKKLEEQCGGYFGTDILNLSTELGVTWHGLKKKLNEWFEEDLDFSTFHYLGRHKPSITLNDFIKIERRVVSNPLEVKSHIYSDINKELTDSNEKSITKPTFYRAVGRIHIDTWFACKKIKLSSAYSFSDARNSLSKVFTYSDLKTYGGADIQGIYDRWTLARTYFTVYDADPIHFYSELIQRERHLRSLLSSIPPDQQYDIQARLTFEIQVVFMVECSDLLLEEIIHRRGRIQQSMNASRQKVENELRRKALDSIRAVIKENLHKTFLDAGKQYFLSGNSR
jgi:hypothetical protein